ncbi:FAD/NAD(P)-binding domain-containing protein [Favolaschia claudopus]|uniref:FAD/NAD(P)-binding domain-containing protein n=1 Tax=Favolaschia claudopus TaxID=2862362 RepID=A0AAW0AX71_9AGAR
MIRNGSTMSLKTVVVLGGAYGGARAAQLIAAGLPDGWRIVLIDRNSCVPPPRVADVYILPRLAVLAGHKQSITRTPSLSWAGAPSAFVQFATDLAAVLPGKPVTLLHSRTWLLPRFDSEMHTGIFQAMESANINVLGERLDLVSSTSGHSTVRTTTGRIIHADLILLCTGQRPNTELLQSLDSRTVNTNTALAQVLRTMQLALEDVLAAALAQIALQNESAPPAEEGAELLDEEEEEEEASTPYPHIFAIRDAANAFGAIPAGHNVYYQVELAARNVLQLVRGKTDEPLERYTPGPSGMKVLLGLSPLL